MVNRGIGASILRNEDERFLLGRGQYVADIALPGTWNAAFLRSPIAHARIKSIAIPDDLKGRVFTAAEMAGVGPIVGISSLAGFRVSEYPVLATKKVRFVGEPIAVALAPERAEAEDMIERIGVEFDPLPAVVECLEGRKSGAPLVHEQWPDNVVHHAEFKLGPFDEMAKKATVKVTRQFRISRQAVMPMESRAALAHYDTRQDELVV